MPLLFRKSVNPTFLPTATSDGGFGAGIAEWTVTLTNSGTEPVVVSKIYDVIPSCMTISDPSVPSSGVNDVNSYEEPLVGATGMVTWEGNRPEEPSNYQYIVPANGMLKLIYQTDVSACPEPEMYTNLATGDVGKTTIGPATAKLTIGCVPPSCGITGPDPVCAGSMDNIYTGTGGGTYSWSIAGNATIVGSTNSPTVSVTAGSAGTYTVTVEVTEGGCTSTCSKTVTVTPNPDCTITGPSIVCPGSTGNVSTSMGAARIPGVS
jgi:PKD domain.